MTILVNFEQELESLKNLHFDRFLSTEGLSYMTLKSDSKFEEKSELKRNRPVASKLTWGIL